MFLLYYTGNYDVKWKAMQPAAGHLPSVRFHAINVNVQSEQLISCVSCLNSKALMRTLIWGGNCWLLRVSTLMKSSPTAEVNLELPFMRRYSRESSQSFDIFKCSWESHQSSWHVLNWPTVCLYYRDDGLWNYFQIEPLCKAALEQCAKLPYCRKW